jgi:hypothetical protein
MISSWSDGLFVLDGGRTEHLFKGAQVSCLAHDGAGGVLAIVDSHSLWVCPAGETWRELGSNEAPLYCCISVGRRILAGTDDARVFTQSADGWRQLSGFDATPGRASWYAGAAVVDGRLLGPPLGVRSMASACDQSALLVNVHVGGIPRSTDGGASWRPTIDIDADVHEVCTHPSRPEIAVAAAASGLCLSRDGGANWTITSEGLHASHCSAVAMTEQDLYIAASDGPFDAEGAVYRRRIDDDGPLQLVGRGLPDRLDGGADTRCIGAHGEALAIADRSGALYGSNNGGASWSLQARGFPDPSGVLIC